MGKNRSSGNTGNSQVTSRTVSNETKTEILNHFLKEDQIHSLEWDLSEAEEYGDDYVWDEKYGLTDEKVTEEKLGELYSELYSERKILYQKIAEELGVPTNNIHRYTIDELYPDLMDDIDDLI